MEALTPVVARALSLRERVAEGRVRDRKHSPHPAFGHLLPEGEGPSPKDFLESVQQPLLDGLVFVLKGCVKLADEVFLLFRKLGRDDHIDGHKEITPAGAPAFGYAASTDSKDHPGLCP